MYFNRGANNVSGEDVDASGHVRFPFSFWQKLIALKIKDLLQRCCLCRVFRLDRERV